MKQHRNAGASTRTVMGGLFLGAWVVVVLWYVVGMIKAGETESEVVVTPEYFEVISAHGVRAPIGAITAVELREDIPDIGSKIRGYNSLTCVKKGEFEVEGMGAGRVYIFTDEGPFVHILDSRTRRIQGSCTRNC